MQGRVKSLLNLPISSTILGGFLLHLQRCLQLNLQSLWEDFLFDSFSFSVLALHLLTSQICEQPDQVLKSPTVLGQCKLIFMEYQHTYYELQFLWV